MRKHIAVLTILIMITGMGAAEEISVSPSNFHEDIVAGDVIDKQVEVTWNGDSKTAVDMTADYSTENGTVDEGFNSDFSPQEFVLEPGETKTVNASLSTHSGLEPNKYFISFNANTETELESETKYVDRTDEVGEEYENELTELEEELNSTRSELTESESRLEELRQLREELEKSGQDTENITRTIEERENEVEQLRQEASSKQEEMDSLQSDLGDLEEENQLLRTGLKSMAVVIAGLTLIGLGVGFGRTNKGKKMLEDLPGRWNQD